MLVVRRGTPDLQPCGNANDQIDAGENILGHARAGKQLGIHLPHRRELFVKGRVFLHEGGAIGMHEELRTCQVVLKTLEQHLSGTVIHIAQILAHVALQTCDREALGSAVVHGGEHVEVARELIAIHRGAPAALKARMPHADTVHGHVHRIVSNTEFHIVAAHKQGKRQPVLANRGNGNAAVPPSSICLLDLDIGPLVRNHVGELVHAVIVLDFDVLAAADNARLARGILEREHGTVQERVFVTALRKGEEIEGAQNALGQDAHVVIHEKDVRKSALFLGRSHHATRKTASAADVGIGDDRDDAIRKSRSVERAAIVHDEHVEPRCDWLSFRRNGPLDEVDVGENEPLVVECRGGERQTDIVHLCLIDTREVMGANDLEARRLIGLQCETDQVLPRQINLDVESRRGAAVDI